jgi:glyoxylase-like metal-dependent hydrolase (beta-lactamase superfamily II)
MKTIDRRMMIKSILGAAGAAIVLPSLFARADGPATTAAATGEKEAPKFPFDTAKIEVTNIAPGIELLTGPGGNIAVLHGKDGTLVVDCGVPSRGKDVLATIDHIRANRNKDAAPDGPTKFLVNTHWHFDHTGGNEALGTAGITIVASENCYKRLSEDTRIEFFDFLAKAYPQIARPSVTFGDKTTLRVAGETILLTHVPPAHTDTDVIVHFKNADVIHAGDLFFNGVYPFIDYSTGGNVSGVIAAADAIMKMAGEKTKIIPGHGPLAGAGDVKKYRDVLADIQKAVRALIAAGKTQEQAIAAKPTAAYDKDWGAGMMNGDVFTKLVYTIEKRNTYTGKTTIH